MESKETTYIVSSQFLREVDDKEPFKQLFFADERIDSDVYKRNGRINYEITHVFVPLVQSSGINFQLLDVSNKNVIFSFVSGNTLSLARKRMFNRYGFPMSYDLGSNKSLIIKGNLGLQRIAVRIKRTITWDS